MPARKSKPILVKLPEDTVIDRSHPLFAYVVNAAGSVVETEPFKGHAASLEVSADTLKKSRLFVGGGLPAEYPTSKIDVYALVRAGYYQVSVNIDKGGEIQIEHLPSNIGSISELFFCEVQGNISNTLTINGLPNSGPVCKARVHICAVEWYYRWPIWLRPIIPAAVLESLKTTVVALHQPAKPQSRRAAPSPAARALRKPLPADVEAQILSATPSTIHNVVQKYSTILYPYFCWWEIFWPWFYRVVEQDVVYTDCNGHFTDWLVSFGAPVDENIYVWVEASIGGTWVTVYNPPFPCNTWWNYACGTEINISLNDPTLPPCNCDAPVVDGSVWFTAIGQYGIATNIQQDVNSKYAPGAISTVGCTNLFDANQLCPFGSQLALYLAFGPTAPATHYRWRWTYILDSSISPISAAPTNVIAGAVERYYLWPLADGSWETGSIPLLDTDADSNIAYRIPNYDVTTYLGVSPLAEWASFNFLSSTLDSTKISNGYVVRLDLELLNLNAARVFEVVSVPVSTFQVSKDTNPGAAYDGSIPAPYMADGSGANYLTLDPATPGNALSLSLKVRVDNSAVTAHINDAQLLDASGNPVPGGTSGLCGFIDFSDPSQGLDLSFVASEPFKFATFSYGVTKGDSGTSVISTGGYVFESAASSPAGAPTFDLSGGVFSAAPSVSFLLSGCKRAAFAELLTVASLATDGSSRLSQSGYPYSAEETNAFALTPTPS